LQFLLLLVVALNRSLPMFVLVGFYLAMFGVLLANRKSIHSLISVRDPNSVL